MKKQIEIVIPAVKERIKKKTVIACDICGHESKTALSKCVLCNRDICGNGYGTGCTQNYFSAWGDYPDRYCTICYSLKFDKYISAYEEIETKYDNSLEEMEEKIKTESLAVKTQS